MTEDELARLTALLAVPSVSALPEHAPDLARAAELCADEVRRAGGSVEIRPGDRHPLVVGEVPPSDGRPDAPRVIVYGHYDVQPAGDPDLWATPAFSPTIRDGRLIARGACDDKGCLFMLLAALVRLREAGRLGVRATVVIDGEEESGGSSAVDWVAGDEEARETLCAIVFDAPMLGPAQPAFCVAVRGNVYLRLRVRTAGADQHSGLYGGAAMNAAHALVAILAAVAPRDGRLPDALLEGAMPLDDAERAVLDLLPGGAERLAEAGLRPADPRAADEFDERTTARPSLDVHGLSCGQTGAVRTIVPAQAEATLSLRLAPGQRGEQIGPALERLLREAAPAGAELEIERLGATDGARFDPGAPALARAADAVEAATGWRPLPVRMGGSLPIVTAFGQRGVPTILSGFYLPDDGIHSPNEGISLEYLDVGTRAAEAILEALGHP